MEHGKHSRGDQSVAHKARARDKAAKAIIHDHEEYRDHETDQGGSKSGADVVVAESRPDRAAFDNVHRSLESAGTKDDSKTVRFRHVVKSRNLGFAVRDAVANDRCADNLVIEDNRHLLADVRRGNGAEALRTDSRELEAHGDFAGIRTVAHAIRTRIGDIFAAHFRTTLEQVETLGLDGGTVHLFKSRAPGKDDIVRDQALHGAVVQDPLHGLDLLLGDKSPVSKGHIQGGKRGGLRIFARDRAVLFFDGIRLARRVAGKEVRLRNLRGLFDRLRRIARSDRLAGIRNRSAVHQVIVDDRDDLSKLFLFRENLEFELRRASDKALRRGIIHARKFDDDAILARRGNQRFGKAELVHAVPHDFERLLLDILDVFRLQSLAVDLQRDACAAGQVKSKVHRLRGDLRILLHVFLFRVASLGMDADRRNDRVARKK